MFTWIIDEIIKRSEIRELDITQEEKESLLDESRKQYRAEKAARQAQNDTEVAAQVAAMTKVSYFDYERQFLADFREKHPNSSAPRRHVIESLYDNL